MKFTMVNVNNIPLGEKLSIGGLQWSSDNHDVFMFRVLSELVHDRHGFQARRDSAARLDDYHVPHARVPVRHHRQRSLFQSHVGATPLYAQPA